MKECNNRSSDLLIINSIEDSNSPPRQRTSFGNCHRVPPSLLRENPSETFLNLPYEVVPPTTCHDTSSEEQKSSDEEIPCIPKRKRLPLQPEDDKGTMVKQADENKFMVIPPPASSPQINPLPEMGNSPTTLLCHSYSCDQLSELSDNPLDLRALDSTVQPCLK